MIVEKKEMFILARMTSPGHFVYGQCYPTSKSIFDTSHVAQASGYKDAQTARSILETYTHENEYDIHPVRIVIHLGGRLKNGT